MGLDMWYDQEGDVEIRWRLNEDVDIDVCGDT